MQRRTRLERAKFKRLGYQFDPIIKRRGRYIKVSGTRTEEWLKFRKEYLAKLPNSVKCHYCGIQGRSRYRPKHKMTLDHKNGRAGNLLTDPDNIVVACFRCNQDKASTPYGLYVERIKER